jgi:hypothetical protein
MSRTVLASFALVAALTGCNTAADAPTDRPDASLRRLADCNELDQRLTDIVLEQLVRDGGWMILEDSVDLAADDGGGAEAGPTDFTTTNNQEAGVDEMDMVKTNGTELFIAEGRAVHIVKSWPAAEADMLSTVELGGWAHGALLEGDTLVVFSSVDEVDDRWMHGWNATRVTQIDVSDPADPVVVRQRDMEGWVRDARLIDGEMFFVLGQYLDLGWETWDELWQARNQIGDFPWELEGPEREAVIAQQREQLRPKVAAILADVDAATLLPSMIDVDGNAPRPVAMMQCDDIYVPDALGPMSMLAVGHLDLADNSIDTTGLLADGWQVYASTDNLYVAQSSQWWWGWEAENVSQIHQFGLHADGEPTYEGSGEVEGWLYDSFAMSEFDGHLRVVTSDLQMWWGDSEAPEPANNVFVMKNEGKGLEVVGRIGGIAPNETIRAARFMGEKAYIVTFEQIDPLFSIDLSVPTDPRITGELKIPGFSAYLHPIGDDHLLAVGMAGLDTGELTGVAVNLFDVSDPASPELVQSHEIEGDGWSWSEAMWDHHAFTYHRDVLTIPAFTETYDASTGTWDGFSGTISFHATPEDGITEIGRVDHRDLVAQSECLYDRWYDWDAGCGYDSYWYARVRRSVYIEDNLFTISDYGVKVNDLNDPAIAHTSVVYYPR